MLDVQLTFLSTSVLLLEINAPNFYPVLFYSFKFNLALKDVATPGEVGCIKMHCNSNACSSE